MASTIAQHFAPSASEMARDEALFGNPLPRLAAASEPVEVALARALDRASEAGRFDVVAQLAAELHARRVARMGNVVRKS